MCLVSFNSESYVFSPKVASTNATRCYIIAVGLEGTS